MPRSFSRRPFPKFGRTFSPSSPSDDFHSPRFFPLLLGKIGLLLFPIFSCGLPDHRVVFPPSAFVTPPTHMAGPPKKVSFVNHSNYLYANTSSEIIHSHVPLEGPQAVPWLPSWFFPSNLHCLITLLFFLRLTACVHCVPPPPPFLAPRK